MRCSFFIAPKHPVTTQSKHVYLNPKQNHDDPNPNDLGDQGVFYAHRRGLSPSSGCAVINLFTETIRRQQSRSSSLLIRPGLWIPTPKTVVTACLGWRKGCGGACAARFHFMAAHPDEGLRPMAAKPTSRQFLHYGLSRKTP